MLFSYIFAVDWSEVAINSVLPMKNKRKFILFLNKKGQTVDPAFCPFGFSSLFHLKNGLSPQETGANL